VRGWLVVAGGAATAGVVLAAWLPVGALLDQRAQLASASGRLAALSAQGRQLAAQTARLGTPGAIDQLGLEQYQLVAPGQRVIQVLPPSFTPTSRSTDAPYPGDPGYAPLADPDGTTTPSSSTTPPSGTSTTAHGPRRAAQSGFAARVLTTLEFWR
jgi:hypothetical protein